MLRYLLLGIATLTFLILAAPPASAQVCLDEDSRQCTTDLSACDDGDEIRSTTGEWCWSGCCCQGNETYYSGSVAQFACDQTTTTFVQTGNDNCQAVCADQTACTQEGNACNPGTTNCCGSLVCDDSTNTCIDPNDDGGGSDGGDQACDAADVNITLLDPSYSDTVNLDWTVSDCYNGTTQYAIHRRNATNAFSLQDTTDATTWTDATSEPETTYYYYIEANFDDGTTKQSNEVSITTGSPDCQGDESFCRGNVKYTCNNGKIIGQTSCELCVEEGASATCRESGPCEECNRLYGMYSHQSNLLADYELPEDDTIYCEDLLPADLGVCYLDGSNTVTQQFKSCTDTTSCADYRSQSTCNANPCNLDMSCDWQDPLNVPGTGFCGGNATEGDVCNDCSDLPGGCTQNKCERLGACYYTGGVGSDECIPESNVICNDYRTQAQCEGGSRIDVDVQIIEGNRSGGTHARLSTSNDEFGLGVCYWEPDRDACYRNADDYAPTGVYDDCNDINSVTCGTDTTPPTTQLIYADGRVFGTGQDVNYGVNDNTYDPGQIQTFYSVDGSYPTTPAPDAITLPQDATGDITVRYYSIDPAKNLEQVKSETLPFDNAPPEVSIDYQIFGDTVDGGQFLTGQFDITVQEPTSYECEWSLNKNGNTQATGTFTGTGTTEQRVERTLEEAEYGFETTCTDAANNQGNASVYVRASGDGRIGKFFPGGQTLQTVQNRDLVVNTTYPGTCKYDTDLVPYDAMSTTFQDTGNQADHTTPIPTSADETGIHAYYIACEIIGPSGPITVDENPTHVIRFAVDQQQPTTNVTAGGEPLPNVDVIGGGLTVTLQCNDPTITDGNSNWQFGCNGETAGIHHCEGNGCTPQATGNDAYNIEYEEDTPLQRFHSQDAGGNQESTRELDVTIDTTPPTITSISIDAPPQFLDPAENLTISSATQGTLTGTVSETPAVLCARNTNSGQSNCATASGGQFTLTFDITDEPTETLDDININATDDVGNTYTTSLELLADHLPPAKPGYEIS